MRDRTLAFLVIGRWRSRCTHIGATAHSSRPNGDRSRCCSSWMRQRTVFNRSKKKGTDISGSGLQRLHLAGFGGDCNRMLQRFLF